MADLEVFAALVRPQIKGPSDPAIESAVIRAARNLCAQSWFVRRLVQLPLVIGQAEYPFALPPATGLEIVGVRASQRKPTENDSTTPLAQPDFGGVNPDRESLHPYQFFFRPYTTIVVNPAPQVAITVPIEIAVQPRRDATVLPDELAVEWDDVIAAGALGILMNQRGFDWYDPNAAVFHNNTFRAGLDNAKAQSLRNYQRANLQVRPRRFAL